MNRTTVLVGLIAAMSISLIAPMASAHDGERAERGMRHFDLNEDGKITRAEADGVMAARFAEADTDGNGALSRAEMTAWAEQRHAERAGRHFDRLDADGDGQLTKAELPGPRGDRIARIFDRLDSNDDGVLSQDEMEAMRDHRGARHGKGHKHRN